MKKQLLALSIMATSGLIAQSNMCDQNQSTSEANCCSECCSTSCCCTPKPKKCIDCECYVPAFYDLQCDWGFFLDAEFLYWYAFDSNFPFASNVLVVNQGNTLSPDLATPVEIGIETFDANWDPGVRVGIGWNTDCDGWDLYLNWTYYSNCSSDSIKAGPFKSFTFDVEGETALAMVYAPASQFLYADTLFAKWRNRLNQIDLEIGRKYWLSPCFTLRPFAGLRGSWTRTTTTLDSSAVRTDSPEELTALSVEFNDRIWGVGIVAGIQPTFYMSRCFALYGQLGAAVTWGKFEEEKIQHQLFFSLTETTSDVLSSNTFDFYKMNAILDLGIGLRYESTWCCDRFRTTFDLGWEHHLWFANGYRANYSSDLIKPGAGLVFTVTDLGYGGLVVRGRFDF